MDNWYFARVDQAEKFLKILDIGISSNLAITAPRRKGKTLFMLNDIAHNAIKGGYIPVYASLWQDINEPHKGIILAFEEAIKTIDKKLSFKRVFNTKVKNATLGNDLIGKVEVEFSEDPKVPPSQDLVYIDKLLTTLQKKAKKKTVLLLIDEVQHLATARQFNALTYALRTMLDKRLGKVKAIFTGSSRHYMSLLFNDSQSAFYHFVEVLPFPDLGDEFIQFLLDKLHERGLKSISMIQLRRAFNAVDQSPYWIMKVLSHMITFDASIRSALDYVLRLIEAAEGFGKLSKKLRQIDRVVFLALSKGESPFSNALLQKIDRETPVKGIYSNVQRSIKRLIEYNLVSQLEKGVYHIEKPGLKNYLLENNNK